MRSMFGSTLARHFSVPSAPSLVLKSQSQTLMAMTRVTMPNGFPGPTPSIRPEKAFSLSVHLKRPETVKGWGMWMGGRFEPIRQWDLGGVQIYDMEADPVALRPSGFDSVHIYLPRTSLDTFADSSDLRRIRDLQAETGKRDDVILHWTRMMLPYFNSALPLPALVVDELVLIFTAHVAKSYSTEDHIAKVVRGGLARWQQAKAVEMLDAHLDGRLRLADLATECGLSPRRFSSAFRKSFGLPVHRYLLIRRIEAAKAAMLYTNKLLTVIALESGFSDQPAFNKSFRAIVGVPPGQWQRQQRIAPVSVAVLRHMN